jgi:hypothetical protein
MSIGTGHRCFVHLDDSEDGREIGVEHARVWIRDGQLVMHELRRLSDLGSTGGRWEFLAPGDVFAIGPYTFQFELSAGDGEETGEVPNILRSANYGGDEGSQGVAAVGLGASPPQKVETQGERSGAGTSADGSDSERTGAEFPLISRLHSDEEALGEEGSAAAQADSGDSERTGAEFPPPSRSNVDEEARGEDQSPAAPAEGGNSPGSSPQFRVQPPPQPPD